MNTAVDRTCPQCGIKINRQTTHCTFSWGIKGVPDNRVFCSVNCGIAAGPLNKENLNREHR